uniref:CUB domain-containing protein n=2 Tax=Wuchereria bancrofti TaxID=6293 RepID=A0AAF5RWM4_WUCBA
MKDEILYQFIPIIQLYINYLSEYLPNIGLTCILSSRRLAVYRISFLIPYLYLSFLPRLTNTSMASCRCVQFNSSGIFQSPDFPKSPLSSVLPPSSVLQHPLLCLLYKFIAPDGYIIEVTFDYFHLSPRTDRCNDYLRLFDGISNGLIDEKTTHNGEFCAQEIEVGQTFYSHTRYLIFHVQLSGTSRGFHGTYNFIPKGRFLSNAIEIEPCRFRVDSLAGNIFSPNYPYFYPTTTNCTYYLAPRQGFSLIISLQYLNLRRYACHEDFIDIYQMHPKVHLEKLCYDSMPPYQIHTTHGYIIEFHCGNNDIVRARGFHISFKYIPQQLSQNIPDESNNPLANDNIPDLAYSSFSLFSSYPSTKFSSAIVDVHGDEISSREHCTVRITSSSVVDSDSPFSGVSGILNSTQYVNGDEPFKCQFIFLGSGTERVQITFLYFNLYSRNPHLNNNTNRCDEMDHLSAHVLIGTRMSRIEDFCGAETPPRLMSTKNLLTLDYVVRSTRAMRRMMTNAKNFGFVLKYHFRSDLGLSEMNAEVRNDITCHYEFNSSQRSSGDIFSPNHPGYYPRNIDCHYIFHGTEKQVVVIHFEYFDVEGLAACGDSTHSDYVLFSNYQTQDRTNRRYCGQICPRDSIVSESNYFRMLFRSNDIFDATGFYAHYQFITEQISQINRVKVTSNACPFVRLSVTLPATLLSLGIIYRWSL